MDRLKYALVHQGGHHDVWCDTVNHLHTQGGFCHHPNKKPPGTGRLSKCDCASWGGRWVIREEAE